MDRRSFLRGPGITATAIPLLETVGAHAAVAEQILPAEPVQADWLLDDWNPARIPHVCLAGTWAFRLDPLEKGMGERWFEKGDSEETIFLPGSTDHRLGLVIEARVGKGKLLATPLPLLEDFAGKPVMRQLYFSLLGYANSKNFNPDQVLSLESVHKLTSISASNQRLGLSTVA